MSVCKVRSFRKVCLATPRNVVRLGICFARVSQENERRPQTLTLKWRHRNDGYGRTSASCPLPTSARPPFAGDAQSSSLVAAALALLARNVAEPFYLTLLNIGALVEQPVWNLA